MKKKRPKFGLLIQGPLFSAGRSGQIGTAVAKNNNSKIIEYDCRSNIDNIISVYKHLFDEIVISTWSDDQYSDYDPEGALRVNVKDITPKIYERSIVRKLGKEHVHSSNNIFRQFYGSYKGMQCFSNSIDYVLKIRTDISVDLESMVDTLIESEVDDTVYIPYKIPEKMFIPDFYFAGKREILEDFFYSMFKDWRLFTNNVHKDIFLKYAYVKYFNEIGVSSEAYKSEFFGSPDSRIIFVYMINKVFKSFDKSIYKDMYWRGSRWNVDYTKKINNFRFNNLLVNDIKLPSNAGLLNSLLKKNNNKLFDFFRIAVIFFAKFYSRYIPK
jgi:hypothetical protein